MAEFDEESHQQGDPVYDNYDEEHEDEVELEGDTGPMLVLEHALVARPKNDEDWRRRSIFHTRCTISGKVCHVIIDNGSWKNTISEDAVSKLGLEKIKHPQRLNLDVWCPSPLVTIFLMRLSVMWLIWMLVISF
jgi:hypothetical protein